MGLSDPSLSADLQAIENQALIDAKNGNPWTIKQYCDAKSAAFDKQIKTATVSVPGTGLAAPNGPVTGTSTTGGLS